MTQRSKDHRYCSCGIWHRIRNGPCEGCYTWKCAKCGSVQPIANPFLCNNCGTVEKIPIKIVRKLSHGVGMSVCSYLRDGKPCGRKMRDDPRDKRRAAGLKRRRRSPVVRKSEPPNTLITTYRIP